MPLRRWMDGRSGRADVAVVALLALVGLCPVVFGQPCPVQIVSVDSQALTSDFGDYGAILRVVVRNSSPFPMRRIDLGVRAVTNSKKTPKPAVIVGDRVIMPNAAETLEWNATRFNKRNGGNQNLILWPVVIELGDRSRWIGNSAQCAYHFGKGAARSGRAPDLGSAAMPVLQGDAARPQWPTGKKRESIVNVTSDPHGANVDVDGRLIGKTPLTFALMKNSNGTPRDIIVYKEGYTIREIDVNPTGLPITLDVHLFSVAGKR